MSRLTLVVALISAVVGAGFCLLLGTFEAPRVLPPHEKGGGARESTKPEVGVRPVSHRQDAEVVSLFDGTVPRAELRIRAVDCITLRPLVEARASVRAKDGPEAVALARVVGEVLIASLPRDVAGLALVVECEGYRTATLPIPIECGSGIDLGAVGLEPVGALRVTVRRRDGPPLGNATVSIQRPPADYQEVAHADARVGRFEATTNDDGAAHFTDVPMGEWRIELQHPFSRTVGTVADVWPGAHAEITLLVPAVSDHLRGRAVTMEGVALPGIFVGPEDGSAQALLALTDATGSFWLLRDETQPIPGPFRMIARDYHGAGGVAHAPSLGTVSWGDERVDVVFPTRQAVSVRVVGPSGEAVRSFRTRVRWPGNPSGVREAVFENPTQPGEQFLSGVPPGTCVVRVEAGDPVAIVEKIVDIPIRDLLTVDIQLGTPCRVPARVVDAGGNGVPFCCVELRGPEPELPPGARQTSVNLLGPLTSLGRWTTDQEGYMQLVGPARTELTAVVMGPNCVRRNLSVWLDPGVSPLLIPVTRGGSLRGALGPEAAASFLFSDSIARSSEHQWRIHMIMGGSVGVEGKTCAIDRSGKFVAEGLAPGLWSVMLQGPGTSGLIRQFMAVEGREERCDIEVPWALPAEVVGRVLLPVQTMGARVTLANERTTATLKLSPEGLFRFRGPSGSYRVRVSVAEVGTDKELWFDNAEPLVLHAGDNGSPTIGISYSKVVLRFVDANGAPASGYRVTISVERSMNRWRTYIADNKGIITLDPAPQGAFEVLTAGESPEEVATIDPSSGAGLTTIVVRR